MQWTKQYAVHCTTGSRPKEFEISLTHITNILQVYNASAEIAAAANYPMIRLFTAALMSSTSTVDELLSIEQNWTVASPGLDFLTQFLNDDEISYA